MLKLFSAVQVYSLTLQNTVRAIIIFGATIKMQSS